MQILQSNNIFFSIQWKYFFSAPGRKNAWYIRAKIGFMLGNLTFVLGFPAVLFYTSLNPLKQVL